MRVSTWVWVLSHPEWTNGCPCICKSTAVQLTLGRPFVNVKARAPYPWQHPRVRERGLLGATTPEPIQCLRSRLPLLRARGLGLRFRGCGAYASGRSSSGGASIRLLLFLPAVSLRRSFLFIYI